MDVFQKELLDLKETKDKLVADEKICMQKAGETGSQFWYRMFIRSFFAHVEGISFKLKKHALYWDRKQKSNKLTVGEIAIINEENYKLKDNGKVTAYPSFSNVDKNLRFAINVFSKVHSITFEWKLKNDPRWNDFKDTIKIRNRLTHPKKAEELDFTQEEGDKLFRAHEWFLETITEAIDLVNKKYLKEQKPKP